MTRADQLRRARPVEVCVIDPGDVGPIAKLLAAARPGAWTLDRLEGELARPDALGVCVADGVRTEAVALGRIVVDELHVLDVATTAARRRRGLGRAVVEGLVAVAVERGCVAALLELRASNAAARGLYALSGFVVVGRRPRYYPDGESAILMTRRL